MIDTVLKILSLPKTLVIGPIQRAYNPYTVFLPYMEHINYAYICITKLNPFAKKRLELGVPYTAEECLVAKWLYNQKPVFALQSVNFAPAVPLADSTTKLITADMAKAYPFQKMYVPKRCIITFGAREENIEFEEFELCESEKFAEVFGQPRKANN